MSTSLRDMINQDRRFIYGTGDPLRTGAGTRADQFDERAGFYGSAADEHFIPLAEGRGGYAPWEQEQILGQGRLNALQLTPEQQQAAFLTGDEINAVRGDPWGRAAFFNPGAEMDAVNSSNSTLRQVADNYGAALRGSYSPDALRMSDPYAQQMDTAFSDGAASIRSGIDPNRLRLSDDFVSNYRMTPEQAQQMLGSVARDTTAASQAELGRTMETARAAGMDPLGVATYAERFGRQARGNTNRALADARVQTDAERARRELEMERARLDAERGYAGLNTEAELALQRQRAQMAQQREDTRFRGESSVADRGMDVANRTGQAWLGVEENAANRGQQQRQFNTQVGTGIASDIQNQMTDAERWAAENRQRQQNTLNQDMYNRGVYADQAMSGRTAGIADTRRQDQQEGRQYLVNQQNARYGLGQSERDRALNTFQTQAGAAQGTRTSQAQQDQQPRWWERAIGGVATGLGAIGSAGIRI